MCWTNFVNWFWYMDLMATKAAHGFHIFCRQVLQQAFIGADYGLLDCETQTPLPDYYTSRLWMHLVGMSVLKTTVSTGPCSARTLRSTVKNQRTVGWS